MIDQFWLQTPFIWNFFFFVVSASAHRITPTLPEKRLGSSENTRPFRHYRRSIAQGTSWISSWDWVYIQSDIPTAISSTPAGYSINVEQKSFVISQPGQVPFQHLVDTAGALFKLSRAPGQALSFTANNKAAPAHSDIIDNDAEFVGWLLPFLTLSIISATMARAVACTNICDRVDGSLGALGLCPWGHARCLPIVIRSPSFKDWSRFSVQYLQSMRETLCALQLGWAWPRLAEVPFIRLQHNFFHPSPWVSHCLNFCSHLPLENAKMVSRNPCRQAADTIFIRLRQHETVEPPGVPVQLDHCSWGRLS